MKGSGLLVESDVLRRWKYHSKKKKKEDRHQEGKDTFTKTFINPIKYCSKKERETPLSLQVSRVLHDIDFISSVTPWSFPCTSNFPRYHQRKQLCKSFYVRPTWDTAEEFLRHFPKMYVTNTQNLRNWSKHKDLDASTHYPPAIGCSRLQLSSKTLLDLVQWPSPTEGRVRTLRGWSCDGRTRDISVDLSLWFSFSLSIFPLPPFDIHSHTSALCSPVFSFFPFLSFFFFSANSIIKHFIPEPYLMPRALHSTLGAKCSLFPAKWSDCYCRKFLITHEMLKLAVLWKILCLLTLQPPVLILLLIIIFHVTQSCLLEITFISNLHKQLCFWWSIMLWRLCFLLT